MNHLREFCEARKSGGRGIWKWEHYFDIYDRHFSRFRNTEVSVLEIGIYSGGSLEMWRDYFGPKSHIYGVDNNLECKKYETRNTKIFIGDQGKKEFWEEFRHLVPHLDIVIDDGSHLPDDQITSIRELLPHLHRGGVYLCEDLHGRKSMLNAGAHYIHGLAHKLNEMKNSFSGENNERTLGCLPTEFQKYINSIHLYPFVAVIEKNKDSIPEFIAPKYGTLWQPRRIT